MKTEIAEIKGLAASGYTRVKGHEELPQAVEFAAVQFGVRYTPRGPIHGAITGLIRGINRDNALAQRANAKLRGGSVDIWALV